MPGTYKPLKERQFPYDYPYEAAGILQGYDFRADTVEIWLAGYERHFYIDREAGGVNPADIGQVIHLEYRDTVSGDLYATMIAIYPIQLNTTAVVS